MPYPRRLIGVSPVTVMEGAYNLLQGEAIQG